MQNNTIVYENLVRPKMYAELNNVNTKTVYDWIKANKLQPVTLCGIQLIDKTIPAPKTYNLTKTTILTAKHL